MKLLIIYNTQNGSILDVIIKPKESITICEGTGTMLDGVVTSDALIGVDESKIVQLFIESSKRTKHGYSKLKRISANSIDVDHKTYHQKKVVTEEQVEVAKGRDSIWSEPTGPTGPTGSTGPMVNWPFGPNFPMMVHPIPRLPRIKPIIATKKVTTYEPESVDVTIKGVGLGPPTPFTEVDVKIHSDEIAERVGYVDVGAIKIETDINIHPNTHKIDIVNKKIIKRDDDIKYED